LAVGIQKSPDLWPVYLWGWKKKRVDYYPSKHGQEKPFKTMVPGRIFCRFFFCILQVRHVTIMSGSEPGGAVPLGGWADVGKNRCIVILLWPIHFGWGFFLRCIVYRTSFALPFFKGCAASVVRPASRSRKRRKHKRKCLRTVLF
jgi:hypothetical protein